MLDHNIRKLQLKQLIDPTVETVVCDMRKVKQIMVNLLSNAIKYTPENGIIEMVITMENGFTKVIISDNGIGISKQIKKLFLMNLHKLIGHEMKR